MMTMMWQWQGLTAAAAMVHSRFKNSEVMGNTPTAIYI
jgi:hypothetical protein